MKTMGNRIFELRKSLGFGWEALASLVGVSHPTIGNWEKDKTKPNVVEGYRLASALNTSVSFLVTGKDSGNTVIDKDLLVQSIADVEQAASMLKHDFTPSEKATFILARYELGSEPKFSDIAAIFDKPE